MMQMANVGIYFNQLFEQMEEKPSLIIELGTYDGEFSSVIYNLRSKYDNDFNFITYDNYYHLNLRDYRKELSAFSNFKYYIKDIFSSLDEIGSIIQNSGKALILCDNGKKIDEVNALCKYMKSGDIIMAHDYSHDNDTYNRNKYWGWLEITYPDIQKEAESNALEFYQYDYMQQVAWMCLKKA